MATRFYLPSGGSAPASPAFGPLWLTGSSNRHPLVTTPSNTALTSRTVAESEATAHSRYVAQFVSDALPARDIFGTFQFVMRFNENTATVDAVLRVRIAVVSGDGLTVRGEAFWGAGATEFATTNQSRTISGTLTRVTAQAGDRLVVEVGAYITNVTTSIVGYTARLGDPTAATDFTFAEGITTDDRPWIEFSENLFEVPPAIIAATLDSTSDLQVTLTKPPRVTVVESYKFENSNATNLQTLATLTNTPQPGDVVVVVTTWFGGSKTPVFGLGGTWTSYDESFNTSTPSSSSSVPSMTVHVCRNPTSAGAVQMDSGSGSMRGGAYTFLLRGNGGGYLSLFPKILWDNSGNVTSLSVTSREAHAGDLVLGVMGWYATSGTPSLSMVPAATSTSGAVYDSIYVESQAIWRTAAGDEEVAVSTTRTSATRIILASLVVTEAPQQPTRPTLGTVRSLGVNSTDPTTATVLVDQHEFLPGDIVLVLGIGYNPAAAYGEYVPSGLGATWTRIGLEPDYMRVSAYVGKDPTTTGLVTLTAPENTPYGYVWVITVRGLGSSAVKFESTSHPNGSGTTLQSPAVAAMLGELVMVLYGNGSASGSQNFPMSPVPATGWEIGDRVGGTSYGTTGFAVRNPTADNETHHATHVETSSSSTALATLRLGATASTIVEALDSTSDLQVSLTKLPRRLAVVMDMMGPNLHPNPDGSAGHDGWENKQTSGAAYVAAGGPNPVGQIMATATVGSGSGLTAVATIEPSALVRYAAWWYIVDEGFGNRQELEISGSLLDPGGSGTGQRFLMTETPKNEWRYIYADLDPADPALASQLEGDETVGDLDFTLWCLETTGADNLDAHITDVEIAQPIGLRSDLQATFAPRSLQEVISSTSDLLVTLVDEPDATPLAATLDAVSDLLITLTAATPLAVTLDSTSDLTLVVRRALVETLVGTSDLQASLTRTLGRFSLEALSDLLIVLSPPAGAPRTERWLLRDTATGVEWRMPINPDSMSSPLPRRQMKFGRGYRRDHRVRTFMGAPEAVEWEWSGVIRSKDHYDRLVEWAERDVAVDVTDHLGRTFRVFITEFNPTDRRPTPRVPWRLRYAMKARILERVR